MGLLLSRRIGSDPYYASYERAFERVEKEVKRLRDQQARRQLRQRAFVNSFIYFSTIPVVLSALLAGWVHRQPPGTYTFRQHLARVLPVVVVPALLYAVYALVMRALRWADSRDAARVKKLLENQRKMVKELKDSTNFNKTMALIDKYDPDKAAAAKQAGATPGGSGAAVAGSQRKPGGSRAAEGVPRVGYNGGTPGLLQLTGPSSAATPVASALMKTGEAAALAAAAAASGAGKALLPMFDKLATSLIGDNPALLEDLRRTQQAAQAAAMENYSLREENARLREELAAAQGPAEALAGADGGRAAASDWERAANAERCEGRSGEDIRSLADALQAAAGTPLSSPGGGGDGKKQQTKSRAAKKAD